MQLAVVAAVDALAVDALRTYGNGYRDLVRLLKAEDVEEKFLSCRIIRAEPYPYPYPYTARLRIS